jgi:hypothetical protein
LRIEHADVHNERMAKLQLQRKQHFVKRRNIACSFPLDQDEAAARKYDDIVRSLGIPGMPVNFPRDGETQAHPGVVWHSGVTRFTTGGARNNILAQKMMPPSSGAAPPPLHASSSSSSLDALASAVQPPPAQLRAALAALRRSGITAADLTALSTQMSRADVSDAAAQRAVRVMLDDCGVRAPGERLAVCVLLAALSDKRVQQ